MVASDLIGSSNLIGLHIAYDLIGFYIIMCIFVYHGYV